MKLKIILFFATIFLVTNTLVAQDKKVPKSIISEKVAIKKYHDKDELDRMQKGELLVLYIERIESLIKTLPYIAFATKPGPTMSTFGIPNSKENRKILDDSFDATKAFLETNIEFQKKMLPYSDKSNLIEAILFYEESMKALHEYGDQ